MSLIWYRSFQQLVLDTQSIQELSPVSQVSICYTTDPPQVLDTQSSVKWFMLEHGALELPLILMYGLKCTCAQVCGVAHLVNSFRHLLLPGSWPLVLSLPSSGCWACEPPRSAAPLQLLLHRHSWACERTHSHAHPMDSCGNWAYILSLPSSWPWILVQSWTCTHMCWQVS